MKKLLLIIISLTLVTIFTFFARGNVSKVSRENKLEIEQEDLERNLDQLCGLFCDDVDNDGEDEIVAGVVRYHSKIWAGWVNEDVKHFVEIPYQADIVLKLFGLRRGKLEYLREIGIEKQVDIPWSQEFRMRDFIVGDFNGDGLNEVFYQWQEQATYAKIIQIKNNKVRTLFGGYIGRAIAELKDVDKDGKLEVLLKDCTWHLADEKEQETILKGHVYAMEIWKWNEAKGKWVFWKLSPDWETEKTLTLEEVNNTPGAEVILKGVPLKKLKEIYPRAFK
jgi:hypothetical protein